VTFPPEERRGAGLAAEERACRHLERQGFTVLARNYRVPGGEWVFVEVKTRRGRAVENPEEAVSRRKAARLTDLAATWLCDHDLTDVDWRLDLVAIELDRDGGVRSAHVARALVAE